MSEPVVNHAPENEPSPDKTFTQAEVDALIGKRIAKVMKGIPSDEELTAYRSWKDNQKTEEGKLTNAIKERDEASKERDALKAELEQIKIEKILSSHGIADEDLEYYAFKIGKLVTEEKDFEKTAEEFFKDHPVNKPVRFDITAPVGGGNNGAANENNLMNSLIRGVRK